MPTACIYDTCSSHSSVLAATWIWMVRGLSAGCMASRTARHSVPSSSCTGCVCCRRQHTHPVQLLQHWSCSSIALPARTRVYVLGSALAMKDATGILHSSNACMSLRWHTSVVTCKHAAAQRTIQCLRHCIVRCVGNSSV